MANAPQAVLARIRFAALALASAVACAATAETPVERGAYLVNSILACGNCHSPRTPDGQPVAGREFSGGVFIRTPAFEAAASNITPDRETGIGSWSDADLRRALVEGVRPGHGRLANVPLAPVMPAGFFKAFLPRDLDAVVAYLRSVKPVKNASPSPVYKLASRHDTYPDADAGFTEAQMDDPVRRGAYLVTIGHCMECHSPREKGVSDYGRLGRGGRAFGPALVQGFRSSWKGSVARNITSHPVAGLGAWSDAQIKRAIAKGISRDGRVLEPPMAFGYYDRMSERDLDAIVAYLRTVPPLE